MCLYNVLATITAKIDASSVMLILGAISLVLSFIVSKRDKERLERQKQRDKERQEKDLQERLDKKLDKSQYEKDMKWLINRQNDQHEEWKVMIEQNHSDNQEALKLINQRIGSIEQSFITHLENK